MPLLKLAEFFPRRRAPWAFACAALIVAGAFVVRADPPPAPPAPPAVFAPAGPTRVAIANPSKIFNEMQETKTLREKLEVRRKELLNKEEQMRAAIKAKVDELQQINPKHPRYQEVQDELDNLNGQLQAWGIATKASVERQQKKMVKDLYDKIEAAVAEVAKSNGIDLVIADGRQDIANLDQVPAEELRRLLNSRNVLFSNSQVDITEKVIALLDAKGATKVGVGQPPPLPK
jgi:Skp family chaperone for outer membrane proteins